MTNTLLYWPPIGPDEKLAEIAPSLSWFFGDWYDAILIPTLGDGPFATEGAASLAGAHALGAMHKVSVVGADSAEVRQARAAGADRIIWTTDIADAFAGETGKPLPGSRTIERLKGSTSGFQYYFVGHPQRDSEEAFLKATFTYWRQGGEDKALLEASRQRLIGLKAGLKPGATTNLFGTGPSLSEAEDADFTADINIVCNSILKDHAWITKNRPTLIIAADAHFHFGYHKYSERFLGDLKSAIETVPDAYYVTFDKFAALVRKKFSWLEDRIIALPASRKSYGTDLDRQFALFPGDSVVNLFMMPLATFLGRDITLMGFTGRAPDDKFFWGHSQRFQYGEEMPIVREAHPAFFQRDFGGYNSKVDDDLQIRVDAARAQGLRVSSRTTTYYKCLAPEAAS